MKILFVSIENFQGRILKHAEIRKHRHQIWKKLRIDWTVSIWKVFGIKAFFAGIGNFQGRVLAEVDGAEAEFNVEEVEVQSKLRVQFSISAGPDYTFQLVDNGDGSVALRTLVELDFERQSQYLLTIVAKVSRGLTSSASARLRVYVDNINDNAPTLDRTEYNFRYHDVIVGNCTALKTTSGTMTSVPH